MDYFEAVKARRSIRKYTEEPVPEAVMTQAFEAAVLAPNSSNTQIWDFYWVKDTDKKNKLVKACLNQSAARTAQELVVVTANPKLWRRSYQPLNDWVDRVNAPKPVKIYYSKLVPMTYRWGLLNSFALIKGILGFIAGIFTPITRGPHTRRDLQEMGIKSSALAAENFVLAISAQGYSTCMMEGFDEWRVKRLLKLSCTTRVVMVISVGRAHERGTWGPQFRLPIDQVVHKI